MKKILKVLFVLILVFTLVGCGSEEYKDKEDIELNDITTEKFNYSFLQLETKKNNLVYSPLSIKYALNMLREGADGSSKEEIDALLKGLTLTAYKSHDKNISFANGLFIRDSYKEYVKDSYIDTLKNKYDAEVKYDSFKNAKNVNSWIKNKTLGIIDKMLSDNLVANSDLILINALAIDMEWQDKFEAENTHGDIFYNDSNDEVAYMRKTTKNASYYMDEDLTILSMPLKTYGDTSLDFVAIMPENLDEYIYKDTIDIDIRKLKTLKEKEELNIKIPKFKFNYDLHLKQDLEKLGVKSVFDENKANLSNISNKNLYVTDALHKADIEFSEDGIKAAAVTVFTMKENAAAFADETTVIYLEFDKPFMFVIRDEKNDEVWFTGTVYNPTLWEDVKANY